MTRMTIPAREIRPGDRLRGITPVVEVTSNWGTVYVFTDGADRPVAFNHGDPVDVDRPNPGDGTSLPVSVDSLTVGDAQRIFQALSTEVQRLDRMNRTSRSDFSDLITHTANLRDVFARLLP